jgi:hypothetical protein
VTSAPTDLGGGRVGRASRWAGEGEGKGEES